MSMKKSGIIAAIVGIVVLAVGIFLQWQMSKNSYYGMSASTMFALGRELGFTQTLSAGDSVKFWLLENYALIEWIGGILTVIGALVTAVGIKKDREAAAINRKSYNVPMWTCGCGMSNKASNGMCTSCGSPRA